MILKFIIITFLTCSCESNYKQERPEYKQFLNYGVKRLKTADNKRLENEIIKSKVEVLGSVLKKHVDALRKVGQDNNINNDTMMDVCKKEIQAEIIIPGFICAFSQ